MDNHILDTLNEAQRAAVCYNEGPHLVIAGAGSGKTRVLTYKIAYMLQSGISPASILALTFTNKAAREMKERIADLVGERMARYVSAGTFHSVFARILRNEADKIGYSHDYTIYDTTDSKSVIKSIIKEMDLDDKIYKVGDVLGRISEAKNMLISAQEYAGNGEFTERDKRARMYRLADIYVYYQHRLHQANAMDFDDILVNMYRLLATHEEARERYQNHFKFILVDEYQDTNYAQYLIIRLLADKWKNICVVGDDAQSIYSFRGADIRNILQFQHEYPGCPLFKLERNYRSTQNIVNAANSLIAKNQRQIPKNVYSENSVGLPLQAASYDSDREEGRNIAEKMYLLHGKGRSYDDMAVLYRTNAQSRVIEDELRKLNIPYRIYGSVSFYQRKEIKDVLSYFRLVVNTQDDEALLRVINFPARGIGDTTMKKVKEVAHSLNLPLYDVVSHPAEYGVPVNGPTQKKLMAFALKISQLQTEADTMDAYLYAKLVVKETGLMTALALDKTQEGIDREENVDELLSALREFVTTTTHSDQEAGVDSEQMAQDISIRSFLAEVALLTDQDTDKNDDTPRLTLMTIHAAKGLEYDVVHIAGLEENLFPSMFCESERELEEERRLFYVAITRAKEECYISSARTRFRNGSLQMQSPSRFLKDIDKRFIQHAQETIRKTSWANFGDFDLPSREPERAFFAERERPVFTSATPSLNKLKKVVQQRQEEDKQPFTCPYAIGSRVRHHTFGDGTVKDAFKENGNEKIIIIFDKVGQKTMLLSYAKLEQI